MDDAGTAIMSCIKVHIASSKVARWGMQAINMLLLHAEAAGATQFASCKRKLVSLGACEAMVAAMKKHATDVRVQYQACAAIRRLAAHDHITSDSLGALGACQAVIAAMRILLGEELALAVCALAALAHAAANASVLASEGAAQAVVARLQADHEGTCTEFALYALHQLLSHDAIAATIDAAGTCSAVVHALDSSPDNIAIQLPGMAALVQLACRKENIALLDEAGACPSVIRALRTFSDSAVVQQHDAVSRSRRLRVRQMSGHEVVLTALTTHLQEDTTKASAIFALIALIEAPPVAIDMLARAGTAVVEATRHHPPCETLQVCGVVSVACLVDAGADCAQLCQCRAPELIAAAMQRFADSADVQKGGALALAMLGHQAS
ncbi:armadillo-type protein [Tribonema minus]|uniref:Armadillo-type protein n=1 Tax=Tribonema minus TaxID=303371 RepID=A0A835Z3F3_9STRA|nr:armadillo-type protein [Tribonema minus]